MRGLQQVAFRAVWLPKAWPACARAWKEHRPDAVLTSGPPHVVHLLGLLLKRRYGLPWVADFRDPWVKGCQVAGVRIPKGWWPARLEPVVMRHADVIAANTPLARETLRDAYPECGEKMVVLTNGFDPEDFAPRDPAAGTGGAFRIVHAGEMYAGRDPRPFLDAVRDLQGRCPCRVGLIGRTGDLTFDLGEEIRHRGLEGAVSVRGQVPYAETLEELPRADILLLMDSPGRRVGVPAKLYEYLGTGRPILALAERDGDLASLLRESGVPHRIASPSDPAEIARGVAELADEARRGPAAPARDGRLAFSREAISGQLAGVLDRLAARPAAAGSNCTTTEMTGATP